MFCTNTVDINKWLIGLPILILVITVAIVFAVIMIIFAAIFKGIDGKLCVHVFMKLTLRESLADSFLQRKSPTLTKPFPRTSTPLA